MSELKIELQRNSTFDTWSAGSPTIWEQVSATATTFVQLQRTDPRNDPERQVSGFVIPSKSSEYIYSGSSSLRARLSSAAIADDFLLRQPSASAVGIPVDPLQKYAVKVTARCSVPGNLLSVKIIGLTGTTDTWRLRPIGGAAYHHLHGVGFEFITTDVDIDVVMQGHWQSYGFEVDVFQGMQSLAVQVGNGTAGAQDIDLGEISVTAQNQVLVGA